jgi:signal transduction histidine kinase
MALFWRTGFLSKLDHVPRRTMALITGLGVPFVALIDYLSGVEISLGSFYLFAILAAAWWVGRWYALFLSLLSVLLWIFGDMLVGINPSSPLVPLWNTSIRLIFYTLAVNLIVWLRHLKDDLEQRIDERAVALTQEVRARERLEHELLASSEREQRRIGQDLHDGLCQHLTGASLAAQVLSKKLSIRAQPESQDASKLVGILEQAIALGRSLARGLHPVDMQPDGLMEALDEFARTTSSLYKVSCRFDCGSPILIHDPHVAGHLYRIAQEAAGNAIKHGMATEISIHLDTLDSGTLLSIEDNGTGLPKPLPKARGIGLEIMAHRAHAVGAAFKIEPGSHGGTRVTCLIPALQTAPPREAVHA